MGHVRVFHLTLTDDNEEPSSQQVCQDIDGDAADDWSGRSVSLSVDGKILAIGAPVNDENGDDAGKVKVYDLEGDWTGLI